MPENKELEPKGQSENKQGQGGVMQEMQMSLTDMIAGMIQATIDADQDVTDDYLEAFTQYAFEDPKTPGENAKLKMVDFEMTDSEGRRQIVSIPKLSLLPLPVLHVSEATFDFEAQLSYRETTEKEKEASSSSLRGHVAKRSRDLKSSAGIRPIASSEILLRREIANRLIVKFKPTGVVAGAPTATGTTETTNAEQSINVKVHIKLQPSTLPNGMRGLLQETDRTMQIIDITDDKDS